MVTIDANAAAAGAQWVVPRGGRKLASGAEKEQSAHFPMPPVIEES